MQTKPNINKAQNIKPIDTIVHFGAGRCSELDSYLTLQPRQLLLVEADPQLAEDLQNRTADCESMQVTRAAVAGKPGPATFHRFTLPEVNSLHRATGLLKLFPGLKTVEQLKVEAVSPVSLLKPLDLKAQQENRLILDLPGEELPVLQALQQAHMLHLFRQVHLHCGREPLYEGSKPVAKVLEWLRYEGFDLVSEDNSQDPDRPWWSFRRNALKLKNRDLQQQVEQLIGKNGEQAQHAADLQAQTEKLTQDRESQTKLANDRQSQLDKVTKASDEQAKVVADLQTQVQKLTQDRDDQTKLANDRQAQLDQLTKTHDEQGRLATDRQGQIDNLSQQVEQVPRLQHQLSHLTREQQQDQEKTNNLSKYLNNNGETLYAEGKFKLAAEYFQRALNMAPNSAWYCQNLAEAVARVNFKKEESWECEQLAKTIAATGKWDVAVHHYRKALKLDTVAVEAHWKAQIFKVDQAKDGQVENPVFILGCGHSGTSLMLALLGNHSRFYPVAKESALFLRTDAQAQKTMAEWDITSQEQGKSRWIEKTPPHVFQIARFLGLRPKSQLILMLRDGRDVVCSLKYRQGYVGFEHRLDRWIYDNMAGLPYWQHPQLMVVKYEDLVVDAERELKAICQFLGEDYNEQMLEFHKTKHLWYSDKIEKPEAIKSHGDHLNLRNWQINQPLFDGRGRWVTEMTSEEKRQFKNSPAQQYLVQFGYVNNRDW